MRLMFATLVLLVLTGCENTETNQNRSGKTLIVYHAGSLALPLKQISEQYTAEHPGTDIQLHAAGSVTCARMISEMGKPCDVFASADTGVITALLIPEYASWYIAFATNEMVIAYTAHSTRAEELSRNNWFTILSDEQVRVGRSDPNSDPCGYRAILTIKLAARHYGRPALDAHLLAPKRSVIRPKSMDLLALLETHSLDYVFIYRSVAEQMGLTYLRLPDEINLSNPAMADGYAQQSVSLTGSRPGETLTRPGEPMLYGVTIPTAAPNPDLAVDFLAFLLNKQSGLAVLEALGQPTVVPQVTATYAQIPDILKPYALRGAKP